MDKEKLINEITAVIMERLAQQGQPPKVVVFGDVPDSVISGGCEIRKGSSPGDVKDCDYIVLSAESYRAFHHIKQPLPKAEDKPVPQQGRVIDMRGNRLIHEMDIRRHNLRSGDVVQVDENAIVTALAFDYVNNMGAVINTL